MSRMQGVNRTMKPSLHELITDEIHHYLFMDDINISNPDCEQLAEQIIKIVRDYHLVDDVTGWHNIDDEKIQKQKEENK